MRTTTTIFTAILFSLALLHSGSAVGQSISTWTGNAGDDWSFSFNWSGGVPTSTRVAYFTGNNQLTTTIEGGVTTPAGAIHFGSTATSARTINADGSSAILRLYGLTLNTVSNTVMWNQSSATHTINPNSSAGLYVGNSTNNIIRIDGAGGIDIPSGITSTSGPMTVTGTGSGVLNLTGYNASTATTTVSGATLRLNRTNGGTLNQAGSITINGGILRVSKEQTITNLTLSSGTLLIDPGVTLTVTGTFTGTGGSLNNQGTLSLRNTSFPGTGVTINNGTAGTMTNLTVGSGSNVTATQSFTISGTLDLQLGEISLGNNDLTMAVGSFISTSVGYVVTNGTGKLQFPNVTTARTFPVGTSSRLAPVTITNTGTADLFGVRVSSFEPSCLNTPQIPFTYAVYATWDISEGTPGGSNCTISIEHGNMSKGSNFNAASAKIAHCNGSTVDYFSGTSSFNTVTGSGFTSFSPFGISSAPALPIEFKSLEATAQNRSTLLTFSTASETNNSHFEIERSADGRTFSDIGRVNGAGTTQEQQDYSFTDEKPLSGINYYRLRQVDYDGGESFSPIVHVTFDASDRLRIAPSPATDRIRISLTEELTDEGRWTVYDPTGRSVLSGIWEVETTDYELHVNTLPEGIYTFRLVAGTQVQVKSFRKM